MIDEYKIAMEDDMINHIHTKCNGCGFVFGTRLHRKCDDKEKHEYLCIICYNIMIKDND